MLGVLDIGGTKIAAALVDEGRLVQRREEPTRPAEGFERAMVRTRAMFGDATLSGIGVGSTGPIDRDTGVYGKVDVLPGWEGRDLRRTFDGVPMVIENDADAAALGEAAIGAGRGVARFVYVTISTGIGGGIVLDGELYRGAGGTHPEIGHHMIEASGPACACGARGCWEALASGPAFAAHARARAPEAVRAGLTAETVCRHANETWAREAIEREAFYLGVGLANVIAMYAPDVIALGGGVMKSEPLFRDRMRETIARSATLVPAATTRIVAAELGADAVLHGAAHAFTLARGRPS
ncbi:MAG: ROK family protein [Labilithrix sp.]|nr:ROK family protein [Labilithrix sp.]MCW5814621.1 ROK family protein [Labilithrix sp.]